MKRKTSIKGTEISDKELRAAIKALQETAINIEDILFFDLETGKFLDENKQPCEPRKKPQPN